MSSINIYRFDKVYKLSIVVVIHGPDIMYLYAGLSGFMQSGTCTLREAIIVASIIARNSIPMLHSAAAILKVSEMDYTGASSIFMRTLLDKKYALPYRVIDAVVFHFIRSDRLVGCAQCKKAPGYFTMYVCV